MPSSSGTRSTFLFSAVLMVVLGLPWQGSAAPESTEARQLCTRLWTEYTDTAKTGDWDKVAAWYADDAVLIYPELAELRGRAAIGAHFRRSRA